MATCAQPGEGWTVVPRRQPARIVEGRHPADHLSALGGQVPVYDAGPANVVASFRARSSKSRSGS